MPKSEWIRVRLDENGAHVSVRTVRAGMTKLDQPGGDAHGRPLPAKYPEPKLAKKPAAPRERAAATQTSAASPAVENTGGVPAPSKEDSK